MANVESPTERLGQLRAQAEAEAASAHRLYQMWYVLHLSFGLATIVLGAVIATTALAEQLSRITVGWIGVAATISSGILTFLGPQSQRDKNEKAAAAWDDNANSAATALWKRSADPKMALADDTGPRLLRFTDEIQPHQAGIRKGDFGPAPKFSDYR